MAWGDGDQAAFEQLAPLVYDELRRVALKALAEVDVRKSQVVEMRYFGGLTVEETAEALKVLPETVMRDWKLAKAWLLRELSK